MNVASWKRVAQLTALALVSGIGVIAVVAQLGGETVTIRGEVFDPDGVPVAGCEVLVFTGGYALDPYIQAGDLHVAVTTTDAAGSFVTDAPAEYPGRPMSVLARHDGHALDWLTAAVGTPVLLQLGPEPKTCSGVVVDSDGKPIAGARVALAHLPYSIRGEFVELSRRPDNPFAMTTDADGRFVFAGLPGNARLDLIASADGHPAQRLRVERDADPFVLEISLHPESTISGKVVHDGKALAGLAVHCNPQHGYRDGGQDDTVTDADGAFTLRHLWQGEFRVVVDPPEGLAHAYAIDVALPESRDLTLGTFHLTPGSVVAGQLTSEVTPDPVQDIGVRASGPTHFGLDPTLSDDEGRYSFRLPPGNVSIRTSHRHASPHNDEGRLRFTLTEGQEIDDGDFQVTVPAPRARVSLETSVSLIPGNEISAYEPLIARIATTNTGDGPAQVRYSGSYNWRIQIRSADGRLVAITPPSESAHRPPESGMGSRARGESQRRHGAVGTLHVCRAGRVRGGDPESAPEPRTLRRPGSLGQRHRAAAR